ncbi:hypothetical protein [Chitinolyticbacter meiyuanensis]|uniref:hypothetical protein n=1 Tax=Chitinolyticbacter meiyuanensis TaxID=682798 RepID=UPI0011E5EE2D|nr:hypothetical protein [Chitinolyticbacter meiyuanensis]
MTKAFKTLICTGVLLAFGGAAQAADGFDAQERAVKQRYDAADKRCDGLSGNAEDICEVQAKADRDIELARINAQRKNTAEARLDAERVRVKSEFNVANEKCDDLAGNKKDVCQEKAKADRDKALADLEVRKDGVSAVDEASKEKREADYKVAKARCDELSGDDKDACVKQAKDRYGQ